MRNFSVNVSSASAGKPDQQRLALQTPNSRILLVGRVVSWFAPMLASNTAHRIEFVPLPNEQMLAAASVTIGRKAQRIEALLGGKLLRKFGLLRSFRVATIPPCLDTRHQINEFPTSLPA
jgi:hypothetical protein